MKPASEFATALRLAAALLTALLLAVCLGIGLYPQPLLATINEVMRGLTFIQSF